MVTSAALRPLSPPQKSAATFLGSNQLLILAVLTALLVRTALLIWGYRHGLTLDEEGTEYVRLAENLRSGHGYVGILNNGIQLNFPPLLPLLIAALSFLLPTAEFSARVVNLLLGSALVVPMFKLAEQFYSRNVAYIVAVLVVFHPLLVARSITGDSETPYLTILMTGVYCVARWIEERRFGMSILAGLFFGLAYLIRPEALIFVGVFAAAGLAAQLFVRNRRPVLIAVLSLITTFALVASPYIAFLSLNSGKFRVQGKGTVSYALSMRIKAGMSTVEAASKIRDDLSGEGVYMKSYYEVLNETSPTARDLLLYVWQSAPRSLKAICKVLATSQSQGSPVLFVLVVVGLLPIVWDRRQLIHEGIFLLSGLSMVLALLSVQAFYSRFFNPFMALLLLWGSKGTEELYHWSHDWFALISAKPEFPRVAGFVVQCTAVFLVLALSLRAVPVDFEFREPMLTERKTSGRWLAQHWPGPKSIMSSSSIPAYYAGGNLMYLPYAPSDLALRYISKKKPDFIVLLELRKPYPPYLAQWFERGIPDQAAKLIYDQSDGHERAKIYRWVSDPRTTEFRPPGEHDANERDSAKP
jgi:4-amino-4-deoxy-L-arabinose transferase-like glycosyltransferase